MNEIMLKLLDECSNNKVNSPYTYNGCPVPRVTAIISRCINNDGLLYWANSLGFKHQSYKQTLDKASSIGTQCHKAIDEYLDGVDEYLDGKIKLMPESNIDMPSICNEANLLRQTSPNSPVRILSSNPPNILRRPSACETATAHA